MGDKGNKITDTPKLTDVYLRSTLPHSKTLSNGLKTASASRTTRRSWEATIRSRWSTRYCAGSWNIHDWQSLKQGGPQECRHWRMPNLETCTQVFCVTLLSETVDRDYTNISKQKQKRKQYILQSKLILILLVKPRIDSNLCFAQRRDKFYKCSFDQIILSIYELLSAHVQNRIRNMFTLK